MEEDIKYFKNLEIDDIPDLISEIRSKAINASWALYVGYRHLLDGVHHLFMTDLFIPWIEEYEITWGFAIRPNKLYENLKEYLNSNKYKALDGFIKEDKLFLYLIKGERESSLPVKAILNSEALPYNY